MCRLRKISSILILVYVLMGCTKDHEPPDYHGFPDEIGKIVATNCAVTGCHNDQSKEAAGGLSLSSWEQMLQGANNKNPVVVPYWKNQSTFFLFTNSYSDLGLSVPPLMPFNKDPLSKTDVQLIMDWINDGAPNNKGVIPFSGQPNRSKYYVYNDGCDLVSVFDLETGMLMRYVDFTGRYTNPVEIIRASQDGAHWYVLGHEGLLIKMDADSDTELGTLQMAGNFWRDLEIVDNTLGIATMWEGNSSYSGGEIAFIDLANMNVIGQINAPADSIFFPQGVAKHQTDSVLIVTANTSNFYYKIDYSNVGNPVISRLMINPGDMEKFTGSAYRPSIVKYTPDYSKYIILCEKSNEVRVYNSTSDSLEQIVPVGTFPADIAFVDGLNHMVVSCMEDVSQQGKGLLFQIDMSAWKVVASVNPGYQPKGLSYDPIRKELIVVNRNADPTGADAPHHYTGCQGNNGYVTKYDPYTQSMVDDYKVEVSVDPYDVDIRF